MSQKIKKDKKRIWVKRNRRRGNDGRRACIAPLRVCAHAGARGGGGLGLLCICICKVSVYVCDDGHERGRGRGMPFLQKKKKKKSGTEPKCCATITCLTVT